MIISANLLIGKQYKKLIVNIPYFLVGVGVLGVGIFPGNITPWHGIFAMTTFVSGGIAAIVTCKFVKSPINYIFMGLGIIALTFLFFSQIFIPFLGIGGTERWVAYPILFWLMGLGSFLLGRK
ncbi:MAG: DUF998 domain-containing protein [Halobacteriota archaeon]|nr:DUF998 domain-containing protein [Halobacteriota archaeon]